MSGGTITKKDLIEQEALEMPLEYSKNLKEAIKTTEDLIAVSKNLAKIASEYQKAGNSSEFTNLKKKEVDELNRFNDSFIKQQALLKANEGIWKEQIALENQLISTKKKNELATESTNRKLIEERVQLEINNRAIKQSIISKINLTEAYDKLNRSRTEAKNKLRDLIASENASTEAIKKAQAEFDKLDAKVKRADDAVRDFTKNVGNYPKLNAFAGGLRNLVGAFGLVGGVTAFASVVKGAAQTVREYEAEIVNLAAIAGKTRKEIQPLEAEIRNVAKSSVNSATEVAKLATELIKLGSTEEEAKLLLKPINDLSVALRASAEDSATLVKSLLNTFGEGADQASRYTDVLAASANYTALGFNELRDSMSYIAPVANAMGYSIEQTAAMVGVLADNGIKAESAGRLLRTMMGNAAKEGTTLEKQLQKVASSTDKVKTATTLFGAEGASLGIILANNKDRVAELTKEFENSKGSLDELTNKQLQSVDSQLKILDSTWQEFILSIENGDGAISRFFVKGIKLSTQLLEKFIELNKTVEDRSNDYFKSLEEGYSESKKTSDKYYQDEFDKNEKIKESQLKALEVLEKKLAIEKETFNYKYLANRKEATDIQKQIDLLNEQIKLTELSQAKIKSKLETEKTSRANLEQEYAVLFTSINKQVSSQDALDYARQKSTKRLQEEIDMLKKKNSTGKEAEEIDKKAAAEAEKRRANQLSKMKQADDDEFALLKFRAERNIEISNDIAENETESIETRIEAYLNAQQVEVSLAEQTAAYKLRAISQYNDEVRDLTNEEIQTLINGGQIKKQLTKDELLVLEQFKAQKEDLDKKDLANRQRIIDSIVEIEQKKTDIILQQQDTELNKRLEVENKLYAENLELLKGNQAEIEALTLRHEEEVFNIKKEYAKKALTEQINALQTLLDAEAKKPEAERISADKIAEIQNKISKYKLQLSEEDLKNAELVANRKVELEKEAADLIRELQKELTATMKDLVFALFDAKIQRIDEDIQANDEYYAQQLEMAEGDAAQQNLIEQERDKKRKALERERRKEEFKAALAQRILATAQIGIDLAKTLTAIQLAAAQLDAISFGTAGTPYRAIQIPLAIGVAAAQSALVLAAPLPKYEKGTQGKPHKGGFAEVGEKRPEVILEPGRNPYVVNKHSILDLPKGTEVIPSLKEWEMLQRAAVMSSLDMEVNKAKSYQGAEAFNARYDAELLEELRRNTEATKKNKSNVVVQNNIDLGHEIWKLSNIKWGA